MRNLISSSSTGQKRINSVKQLTTKATKRYGKKASDYKSKNCNERWDTIIFCNEFSKKLEYIHLDDNGNGIDYSETFDIYSVI